MRTPPGFADIVRGTETIALVCDSILTVMIPAATHAGDVGSPAIAGNDELIKASCHSRLVPVTTK